MKCDRGITGEADPSQKGLWRSKITDTIVSDKEYQDATDSLQKHLAYKYRVSGDLNDHQCYLRGDNLGHRTQHCEILDISIFSEEFLCYLQCWVKMFPEWRIATPCHLGTEFVVFIYPGSFRYVGDGEINLTKFVAKVQGQLLLYSATNN